MKIEGQCDIRKVLFPLAAVGLLALSACSLPVTLNRVQSFDVQVANLDQVKTFQRITGVLVDRGYDIKVSDRDAGILTTEYKKFASEGDTPPFDYYLQIKVTLRDGSGGRPLARLSPIVKAQNRLNASAFIEEELSYYSGEPSNVQLVQSQRQGGWRDLAQIAFMNVVSDIADFAGVRVEEVQRNVTAVPMNAFLAR